jgi:hypothetical protein
VTVSAKRLPRWLAGFVARHDGAGAEADPDTVALTGGDGARAWVRVPFPPLRLDATPDATPDTAPDASRNAGALDAAAPDEPVAALVAHVQRQRTLGVVLVRRGGHAAGVFRGAELIASKVGTSYVQSKTKAGGQSQQRYARRRANQATAAFAKAADVTARVVLPHLDELDSVVVGGDRLAVEAVLDDPRLSPLRALITEPLLPVPDQRLTVLRASIDAARSVRIRLVP